MFLKWALKNKGTFFPIFFSSKLTTQVSVFNPSLSISKDGIGTFVFRTTKYRYLRPTINLKNLTSTGSIQYLYPKGEKLSNSFFFTTHDFTLNTAHCSTAIQVNSVARPNFISGEEFDYSAIEDFRICRNGERFILLGNIGIKDGFRRPLLYEIDPKDCFREKVNMQNPMIIDEVNMNKIEKNWLPIEDRPGEYVRWPISHDISGQRFAQIKSILNTQMHNTKLIEQSNIFGGSQLVKFDSGYLCITHSRKTRGRKNNHQYFHQFLYYDLNFRLMKTSNPFTFLGFDTEFCSGLTIFDNKIFLSFSCNDSLNFVLSFNLTEKIWDEDFEF